MGLLWIKRLGYQSESTITFAITLYKLKVRSERCVLRAIDSTAVANYSKLGSPRRISAFVCFPLFTRVFLLLV